MSNVKLGVIGFGNMGRAHTAQITMGRVPGMEVAAICDIDESCIQFANQQYPNIPTFNNADDLINSGLCDTVIVAVYHYAHTEIAMKAFAAGLNVIVEKPAGVYTKQVREMNEAAAKGDKVYSMMYNQRTNPVYQKLREMVQSGELGHIKRITWIITDWYRPQAYHNSSTWRSTWRTEGGGALINQNPHQLDLWQWIFGVPDRVFAKVYCGKYHDIEVEDDVMAFFEYDNGTTGEYITSTGEAPGTNRLEVACDMGKIVIEGNRMIFDKNEVSERDFEKSNTAPFGCPRHNVVNLDVDFSGGQQHVGIFKNVVAAITEGAPLLAPLAEGIKGLTISNAIHLSGWTGETIDVKNFPDDRFYDILQEKIKNSTVVKAESKVVADTTGTY